MNEQLKQFMLCASPGDLWYLSNASPAGEPVTNWVFTTVPGNLNPDHGAVERDQIAGILNSLSNEEEIETSNSINSNAAYPLLGGVRPPKGEIIRK